VISLRKNAAYFQTDEQERPNITPLTNRYFKSIYTLNYEVRPKDSRTVLLIFYHRFKVAEGALSTINKEALLKFSVRKMDSCQIGRITFIIIPLTCFASKVSASPDVISSWVIQSKHNALANGCSPKILNFRAG
jgi:hypothetical protein